MATTTRFQVPGISCDHCKSSIEGGVGPDAGVASVEVDVAARTVTIAHDPDVADAGRLVQLIEEQGYDVEAFEEVG